MKMKTWGSGAARKQYAKLYVENKPVPKSRAGRRAKVNPVAMVAWRMYKKASIAATAKYFGVDPKTVKTACRQYGDVVKAERSRYGNEKMWDEIRNMERVGNQIEEGIRTRRAALEAMFEARPEGWGEIAK